MRLGGMAVLATAVVVAACSPYRLGTSVASFRQSVADTQAALDDGLANLQSDTLSNQNARFAATNAQVQTTAACGSSSDVDDQGQPRPPCTLVPRGSADPPISPVYAGEAGARMKLAALLRYAEAMQALTDAADRKALDTATDA